jgi:hypothetical protein
MSVDHDMMNYETGHYRGSVDFISPEGPLRSVESEVNVAAIGTEYDLGTVGKLSIPPEDSPVWEEWKNGIRLRQSIGGKAVEAVK